MADTVVNSHLASETSFPVAELIGFRIASFGAGEATIRLDSGPQHYNPMGTVHGGILSEIADAAMGIAFRSTLEETQSFTTLELKINFLRPVWETTLTAHARVTSRGRTVGLVECDVTDSRGRLMAQASSTCLVLSDNMAKGR